MRPVRAALQHRCFRPALAVWRDFGVDQRVLDQLLDRTRNAVAVERIGVLVARDHEPLAGLEHAALAVVVVDVARA